MTPERWARIKDLFNAALERDEAERAALLGGVDADLRAEVERLLREHRETTGLVGPLEERNMSGRTVSHYQILDKIGQGGMGVVYQAEDTRLHRKVALKFLRREAVESAELKARFLREAEAAAALDHSNICTVYEIDEADGRTFLAMAYVDGPSLKDKIRERPLKLGEALDMAIQIGEGLQAAHEKGIVHRDIKSGNVMLTSRGQVKIVDFGLAHLAGATKITRTGSVTGTPAYMSPEQVRGEEADHRSDIWAMGVVLYEMVTGRLPFGGETAQSVALAVQSQEPDPLTALRSGVPVELDRIAGKALAKKVRERYPHIEDLLVDLRALKRKLESGWQPVPPKRTSQAVWYIAGGALVAALAVVAWWAPWSRPAEAPLSPVPLTTYPGFESGPSFSPDGNEIAFAWNGEDEKNFDIYRKSIGPGAPLRLTSDPAPEAQPRWSPDGQHIAFRRRLGAEKGGIFLIPSLGGVEQQLMELEGRIFPLIRHAWSPDGKWLVTSDGNAPQQPYYLVLLSVATRDKRRLTDPPQDSYYGDYGASFSPDGRSVVFCRGRAGVAADIYSLALTEQLTPRGEPKRLTHDSRFKYDPIWMPDGRDIVFTAESGSADTGADVGLWRVSPGGADARPLPGIGPGVSDPTVSGPRRRLAYSQLLLVDRDIWRIEITGPERTAGPPKKSIASTRPDIQGRWSPDGTRIAFLSERSGNAEIWLSNRDGSNAAQLTSLGGARVGWPSWSPDGKSLAFDLSVTGQREIHVISVNGGVPQRMTNHPADEAVPCWSHDGKWIYFTSHRTGRYEIWKIPSAGGEPIQVTKNGGFIPFESPDGEFVYYALGAWATSLWRVPVEGGEETQVLDSIDFLSVAVVKDGIYFIPGKLGSIDFLEFSTGKTRRVLSVDKPIRGLSVSPDGQSILYDQSEGVEGRDLMLVENFR